MADYYYIDLYFDPERIRFGGVVDSCIKALTSSGCEFRKVLMFSRPEAGQRISSDEHIRISPGDLKDMAEVYLEEAMEEGSRVVSFPPLGRVMFECGFRFDEALAEEIEDEEHETKAGSRDVGAAFVYTENFLGKRIKASISFWEEYVLEHGDMQTHLENMKTVISLIENINSLASPVFGAMNSEIRLDSERSLELLMKGKLPEGNEFALVGEALVSRLDMEALRASSYGYRELSGGGFIMEFTDRWKGRAL